MMVPSLSRMLNKKLTMKDIESIDPEFFNSLVWIRYTVPIAKKDVHAALSGIAFHTVCSMAEKIFSLIIAEYISMNSGA
jgi:hypothetical protein